jgi:uncharacterized protein YozE (UPF0346 family)
MDNNNRKLIEKQFDAEEYIEALKNTVQDLKAALYTISLLDNIDDAIEIAEIMLSDFYVQDTFIKKTTLQKEAELFKTINRIPGEKEVSYIGFKQWIKKYENKDNQIGDLAEDIKNDPNFPEDSDYKLVLAYLQDKKASAAAIRTFKRAYNIYKKDI